MVLDGGGVFVYLRGMRILPFPFFLGFGLLFPMPFLVITGTANPLNGALMLVGVALMTAGVIRAYRTVRKTPPSGEIQDIDLTLAWRQGVVEASEEAHRALLDAGEDPRAADSMRNRIRGVAGLEAL